MREGRTLAFYRSPGFRYVQIITGAIMTVSLLLPGQDNWRNTQSLRLLHVDSTPVALVWALIFAAYTVLLIINTPRTSEMADWLGLFAGLVFLTALFVIAVQGNPINWIATGFVINGVAAQYAAARLAHFDRAGIR